MSEKTQSALKAQVKSVDMSETMEADAKELAEQAIQKFELEKDAALFIKKEFDKKYKGTWHCVVGRSFGSYVTHETKHFIYLYVGSHAVLLFKSAPSDD